MSSTFVDELLDRVDADQVIANKSIAVEKEVALEYDLSHLLAVDCNAVDSTRLSTEKESYLKELTRDNTQLIVNKLWQLNTKRVEDTFVAELPKPSYLLPRSKAVPKPKAPTKWQTYAKDKGIQKRKKEKLIWDETSKQWKPRFGFKGIKQTRNKWLIEVPDNADPNVDYFAKQKEEKKERIAKNEFQRLRNIAKGSKVKASSSIIPQVSQTKDQLSKASRIAKESTASVGKFTEALKQEKPPKNSGKKRKFEPNLINLKAEKDKNLKIINDIMNKKPKLDIDKAITPLLPTKSSKKGNNNRKKGKRDKPLNKNSKSKANNLPKNKRKLGNKFGNRKNK